MKTKDYWIEKSQQRYYNCYRLQCPKCHHVFIMSKPWGVWKGCPICWTKLEYKYREKQKKFDKNKKFYYNIYRKLREKI